MSDQTNDPTPDEGRLPYHAPELRDHGTMRDITQASPPPDAVDPTDSTGYGPATIASGTS
jgi:hypothetical protein